MYGEKKVPADNWLWTAKLWEKVRDELIKNKEICPRCNGTAKSVDYISWLNEFKEIPCYLCKGTGNVIKGER